MTVAERRSITAKANIAVRGRKKNPGSMARRALTMERTLQLASRANLILGVWLSQRGIRFVPQKALGPYNLDIAVEELRIAVEVNGSWHYFPDETSSEAKRRNYLFDRGWRLIEVNIANTDKTAWKYLRPACADKIVALLNQFREHKASVGQYCVIGGDGEFLPGR